MNESKPTITVDPDGSVWYGIEVTQEVIDKLLKTEGAMDAFRSYVFREFCRLVGEKMDRDLTGGM